MYVCMYVCDIPPPLPLVVPDPEKCPNCLSKSQTGSEQHFPAGFSRRQCGGRLLYVPHLKTKKFAFVELCKELNNGEKKKLLKVI